MQPALVARTPVRPSPMPAGHATVAADREVFADLLTRYQRPVFAYLYRMIGDADDAEDLTQETFLRAYGALPRAVTHPTPLAWLFRIAANAARDELRRRRRIRWLPWEAARHDRLLHGRRDEQPETAAVLREQHDLVQGVLDRMTPRYREALLLLEYSGLSCAEIGAVTGTSRAAVKSVLFRAREEFRGIASTFGGGFGPDG